MYIRADSWRCGTDLLPKSPGKAYRKHWGGKPQSCSSASAGSESHTRTPKYSAVPIQQEAPQERREPLLPCGRWGNTVQWTMSKSGLWPNQAHQKDAPVLCCQQQKSSKEWNMGKNPTEEWLSRICTDFLQSWWHRISLTLGALFWGFLFSFFFFLIPLCSASYKLISVRFSYFFCGNTTFTGLVLAGAILLPPVSITPFCIRHQVFAFLDMFQVRCFGLALNYSLKKTMQISRKLNWPVQFGCLVTWTTQSKQFQTYSWNISNLIGTSVKAPFKSVPV